MSEIDQQFIEYVVKSLVGKPDAVHIDRRVDENGPGQADGGQDPAERRAEDRATVVLQADQRVGRRLLLARDDAS